MSIKDLSGWGVGKCQLDLNWAQNLSLKSMLKGFDTLPARSLESRTFLYRLKICTLSQRLSIGLGVASFIFVQGALSAPLASKGFVCQGHPRQSRLQIEAQGDWLKIRMQNPMGYQHMPQFEGPVAPILLPFQKMQAEDLKDLGSQFEWIWKLTDCDFKAADFILQCAHPAWPQGSFVSSIAAQSISTTEVKEKLGAEGDWQESRRFRTLVLTQGNYYFVSWVYALKDCRPLK